MLHALITSDADDSESLLRSLSCSRVRTKQKPLQSKAR
jgi:hypothetical protein